MELGRLGHTGKLVAVAVGTPSVSVSVVMTEVAGICVVAVSVGEPREFVRVVRVLMR